MSAKISTQNAVSAESLFSEKYILLPIFTQNAVLPREPFFLWKIRKIFKKFVCWIFTQNAVNAESLFSVKYNKNISKICQLKLVPKMQLVLICLPRMQQVLKFLPRIVSAVIFTQNAVGAEIFTQNVK